MSEERLSKLQKLILRCVAEYPPFDMEAPRGYVAWEIARCYNGDNIWRLKDLEKKMLAEVKAGQTSYEEARLTLGIAGAVHSSPHGKTEVLRGQFSVTFSRSLRGLEKKGLVELKRRWVLVSTNEPYGKAYWIKLTQKARNILNVKVSPHSEFWNGYLKEHYGGKICEVKRGVAPFIPPLGKVIPLTTPGKRPDFDSGAPLM